MVLQKHILLIIVVYLVFFFLNCSSLLSSIIIEVQFCIRPPDSPIILNRNYVVFFILAFSLLHHYSITSGIYYLYCLHSCWSFVIPLQKLCETCLLACIVMMSRFFFLLILLLYFCLHIRSILTMSLTHR